MISRNVLQQEGIHLRVGVSPWGYMSPECLYDNKKSCERGPELEILTFLMALLNLTVELKYSNLAGCGRMYDNGSWNGLFGMLQRNEIDIIGNLCTATDVRTNQTWLKFTWPVWFSKNSFLMKKPSAGPLPGFFTPFEPLVWVAFACVLLIFLLLFGVIYFIHLRLKLLQCVKNAANDVFKMVFGFDSNLMSMSWFYCLCFVGYVLLLYSSFVTLAILKVPAIDRPFTTDTEFLDLVREGTYELMESKPDRRNLLKISFYERQEQYAIIADSLLQKLLNKPNLVLMDNKLWLLMYLNSFPQRHKLWLFDDDIFQEMRAVYFYRKDLEKISKLLDMALILMSDSKQLVSDIYVPLSRFTIQSNTIKAKLLSNSSKISVSMLSALFFSYALVVCIGLFTFMFEILHGNRCTFISNRM